MSLVFSNPTGTNGIVERLRRKVGVSNNPSAYPLSDIVSDVNAAVDAFTLLALEAAGKWNPDDPNQAHQPVVMMDLVAGQRDYTYLTDQDGNLILDIYKVLIADQNGFFREADPVDPASEEDTEMFWNGQNVQGIPYQYDKSGTTLNVNPIPNYSTNGAVTGNYGIKAYINRESTYFSITDTLKVPGFPGPLHEYLVTHPASQYATRKQLSIAGGVLRNGSTTGLIREVQQFETTIKTYYGNRAKDAPVIMGQRITRFK